MYIVGQAECTNQMVCLKSPPTLPIRLERVSFPLPSSVSAKENSTVKTTSIKSYHRTMLQAKPGIHSEKGIRSLTPGSIGN